MVVAEVLKLASAAEYFFFKMGVEGKRFRPTVLLLMATTLNVSVPRQLSEAAVENLSIELRTRRQCIAEITDMIHVNVVLFTKISSQQTLFWITTLSQLLSHQRPTMAMTALDG